MIAQGSDIGIVRVELSPLRKLQGEHEARWGQLLSLLRFRQGGASDAEVNASMEALVRVLTARVAADLDALREWALALGEWVEVLGRELAALNLLSCEVPEDGLAWEVADALRRPLTLLLGRVREMSALSTSVRATEEPVAQAPAASVPVAQNDHDRLARAIRAALSVEARPERVKWVGVYFGWLQAGASPFFYSYAEFVRYMWAEFADVGGRDCRDTYKDYYGDPYLTNTAAAEWTEQGWKESVFCKGGVGAVRSKYNIGHFEVIRRSTLAFLALGRRPV